MTLTQLEKFIGTIYLAGAVSIHIEFPEDDEVVLTLTSKLESDRTEY